MAEKLYDIKAKVGEYQKDGQTKNQTVTVGAMLKGQYGPFIILNKWVNLAGLPSEGNSVILNLSAPNQTQNQNQQQGQPNNQPQQNNNNWGNNFAPYPEVMF